MWLKGVVMRAHFNGKIPRNPFAQFHISPNCKEREFLSEDELKAVVTHEFEDCSCSLQIFYSPQMNSLARMLDSNVCQNKVTGKDYFIENQPNNLL